MAINAPHAPAWDPQRLKSERLERIQQQMRQRGIGALYLTDGPNLRYVLNMKIPGADVFVPPHGDAIALVRRRDVGYVQLQHATIRPPMYRRSSILEEAKDDNGRRFAEGVAGLMAEFGVKGEPLGTDQLRTDAILALMQLGIPLRDAVPTIEFSRAVKTRDEITIYREVGEQYAETFRAFRDAIRPGVTEKQLANVAVAAWQDAGGDSVSQINVCAGENMNAWRRWPTDRPLQAGEFVGMDLHAYSTSGLRGDVSRTYVVPGRPSQEQQDLYRRAHEYLLASAANFRAGRSYKEILAAGPPVPESFKEQLFDYNVAHSVGMTPSGYPSVDPRREPVDDVLEPNQVLAVECYFGEVGKPLAVKLEEMIVVRDGPPEVLGTSIPFDENFL